MFLRFSQFQLNQGPLTKFPIQYQVTEKVQSTVRRLQPKFASSYRLNKLREYEFMLFSEQTSQISYILEDAKFADIAFFHIMQREVAIKILL